MPIPPSLSAAARRRVLIVDHDARHLETLERASKAFGSRLDVICVDNGVDAMVQVGAFAPHLVLLDAHMPHFDSFEVARRLQSRQATHTIRVLLACQQLTPELQQRATEAGVTACVQKPVTLGVMFEALGIDEQAIAS